MIILPIDPGIADGVAAVRGTTHTRQTISLKVIVTDAACSGARVYRNPADVSPHDMDRTTSWDGKTSIRSPRLTLQVLIGGGTTVSPTRAGSRKIIIPKGPTGSVEVSNAQPFHTSINKNSAKNGDPTTNFSKGIVRELSDDSSTNIYLRCQLNFMRDAVVTESPKFMNLELLDVHASDKLGSFSITDTVIIRPKYAYNWILHEHLIGEVTGARMSGTRSEQN